MNTDVGMSEPIDAVDEGTSEPIEAVATDTNAGTSEPIDTIDVGMSEPIEVVDAGTSSKSEPVNESLYVAPPPHRPARSAERKRRRGPCQITIAPV